MIAEGEPRISIKAIFWWLTPTTPVESLQLFACHAKTPAVRIDDNGGVQPLCIAPHESSRPNAIKLAPAQVQIPLWRIQVVPEAAGVPRQKKEAEMTVKKESGEKPSVKGFSPHHYFTKITARQRSQPARLPDGQAERGKDCMRHSSNRRHDRKPQILVHRPVRRRYRS